MTAPAESRRWQTFACPLVAAQQRAPQPVRSTAVTSAPVSSSSSTHLQPHTQHRSRSSSNNPRHHHQLTYHTYNLQQFDGGNLKLHSSKRAYNFPNQITYLALMLHIQLRHLLDTCCCTKGNASILLKRLLRKPMVSKSFGIHAKIQHIFNSNIFNVTLQNKSYFNSQARQIQPINLKYQPP